MNVALRTLVAFLALYPLPGKRDEYGYSQNDSKVCDLPIA